MKFLLIFFIFFNSLAFSQGQNTKETQITSETPKELKKVIKEEESNIYRHRDLYFITGGHDSKVQFSFKIKPLLYENLYFGYTQLMFWQLQKNSSPFYDVNYNPELYYEWQYKNDFLKEIRLGLEHRSNGQEKELSRSMDRIFLNTLHSFSLFKYQLLWNNRFFYVYDIDWHYNRDIRNYSGVWSTQATLQGLDNTFLPSKAEVYLGLLSGGRNGQDPEKGSLEFGAKYRLRVFGILPHLTFQYYYGYLESMREYNVKHSNFRIGFIF